MPNNQETGVEMPQSAVKRLTNIFFLVDTSGSMDEQGKIDAVNNAMHEAIPVVRDFASKEASHKIQCSILEFNSGINWITEQPVDAEDLQWIDLKASGGTCLGAAYTQLASKLTRKEGGVMAQHLNNAPIIILLTDGYPTDDSSTGLSLLKKNRWFMAAVKIAIEITGGDVDRKQLIEFTGTNELVIPVASDRLQKELKNIVVKSMTNSTSAEDVVNALTGGDNNDKPAQDTPTIQEPTEVPTHTSGSIDLDDFDF